jgi:predicted acetyltransferase
MMRMIASVDIELWPDLGDVSDERLRQYAWAGAVPFGSEPTRDLDDLRARKRGKAVVVATTSEAGVVGCLAFDVATLQLPGGSAACGRIADVGVLPSHRRRGILTRLLETACTALRDSGTPLAALYASEAPIYGRFGFGVAAAPVSYEAVLPWARPLRAHATSLTIRPAAGARSELERIHAATLPRRLGDFSRTETDWDLVVEGYGDPRLAAVAEDGSGYALYEIAGKWDGRIPTARARVVEVVADSAESEAELWRFCLSLDLVAAVESGPLPSDHMLPVLVADRDRLAPRLAKPLYLRVLDVPAALRSRRYAAPTQLTLEVEPSDPTAATAWHLDVGQTRCDVEPASGPADLTLSASALGAAMLGQVTEAQLLAGYDAREHTSGALRQLTDAFATAAAACPTLTF